MATATKTKLHAIGGDVPTNGAKYAIETQIPYQVAVELTGASDLLFHRWNCEAVEMQGKQPKNSKAKKTDNVENYVYRMNDEDPTSNLALPGELVRMSVAHSAKFSQDPRSPRKSAMDLFKAGLISLTPLSDLGCNNWDYVDIRRAIVQRSAINRHRPALKAGWKARFDFQVIIPEYISHDLLHLVLVRAGQLVGVADFRPTYGRFNVTHFSVIG